MNIAVYSGSFNPLHIGHEAILRFLTREGLYDEVYLVVSPQSPFKDASQNESAVRRYAAAVEALRRHPDIRAKADDIELGMEPPCYTIRTLDALREREPGNDFTLVIGADNLESFPRWRDRCAAPGRGCGCRYKPRRPRWRKRSAWPAYRKARCHSETRRRSFRLPAR